MAKPQPAAKFRLGDVTATVRNNDDFFNTVLSKSYRDGDDWKDTDLLGTGKLVQLTSMASVFNVNALASDQILNFDQSGLTIIYGGNGSGKSGYSRALKRACRARDQSEASSSPTMPPRCTTPAITPCWWGSRW